MADVSPFHAYRYNLDRVTLADVVTQPYDKITPAMQERYLAVSPYNLIQVEKGKPEPGDSPANNVYTRAEQVLAQWIRDSILVRDSSPALYAYFQEYTVPGTTERRTRKGFIGLGRVEDYASGVVFRHEQTLTGPKADRLELLRHTRTHTGQLFMLYTDPECRIDALLDCAAKQPVTAQATDEYDVTHRLWAITNIATIATIVREIAPKKLVIADGHHRYETALAYRNEQRAISGDRAEGPYERAMMTFFNTRTCNAQAEGLLILPTHRVVSNLSDFDSEALRRKMEAFFEQENYIFGSNSARAAAYEKFCRDLQSRANNRPAVGMYAGRQFTLFRLRPDVDLAALMPDISPAQRQLDVVLLHRILLEKGLGIAPAAVVAERNITYERDMHMAIAAVDQGVAQVCFLLNGIGVEEVAQIALAGEVLPQKSTDFYPKLLSGLTLYRLEQK